MSDKLDEICEVKREYVVKQKQAVPLSDLEERIKTQSETRGFMKALKTKADTAQIGLISEIKKASPSKGLIREAFDPAAIAKEYERAGVGCLSVLTDAPYFQGNDGDLITAREACTLPVLRKDFMVDSYQIIESRAIGADCILIIMAALSDAQAKELEAATHELGMDVLIEVHDEEERDRALTHLSSRLIGVNNRNLKTLEVNLENTPRIAQGIPADYVIVCESGIKTHDDVKAIQAHDIHCFLVGESLLLQRNIYDATVSLLGTG